MRFTVQIIRAVHDVEVVTRDLEAAFRFLEAGGRLVSILPTGTMQREDKAHRQFRAFVEAHGGRFEPLAPGSFAPSGTMVNTEILIIDA